MKKIIKSIFNSLKKQETPLPKIKIEEAFPGFGNSTVTVFHPASTPTGCRLIELVLFGYLAGSLEDIRFFEIGTSEGRTARNVAINLRGGGSLTSMDLAPEQTNSVNKMPASQKKESLLANAKFLSNLPEAAEKKITLLRGDSSLYDFRGEIGKYDVVFVDGNHATEAVLQDAQTAKQLLRAEGGIILFHDYLPGAMPTVVNALHMLRGTHPLFWLEGTKLAMLAQGTPRIPVARAFLNKP